MVVKFNLRLTNPSPENWQVWKDLESEIKGVISQHECEELERIYDEVKFEKSVTLHYKSDNQLCKLLNKTAILAGKHGLEVDITDRVKLSSPSLDMINNHKGKYRR